MSDSADEHRNGLDEVPTPFGGEDILPFEKQRRVHQFLTQETRYHVVQTILGHPAHLVTLDELEYLVPKNRSTIREHLDRIARKQIVTCYTYDGESKPTEPTEFWGVTEYGVVLLDEYDYLRYVPVLRALQDALYLTEKIERHRNASRPPLPDAVATAFDAVDLDDEMAAFIDDVLSTRDGRSDRGRVFDAPPIDPPANADGDGRPIDDLFENTR